MSSIELNDPEIAGLISPSFASVGAGSVGIFAPPLIPVSADQLPVALGEGESAPTSATLTMSCMNESGQNYKWYANNGSGGGLSDGHTQLFSYNSSPNWCAQVVDVCPQNGTNSRTSTTWSGDMFLTGNNGTGLHLSGCDSANGNLRGIVGVASQKPDTTVGDTFNIAGGYNNNFEIIRFPQSGASSYPVLAIDASDNVIVSGSLCLGTGGVNNLTGSSGLRCFATQIPALAAGGTGSGAIITATGLPAGLYTVYTDYSTSTSSAAATPYELSATGYFDGTYWRGIGASTFGNDGQHFTVLAQSADRTSITVNNNTDAAFDVGMLRFVQLASGACVPSS